MPRIANTEVIVPQALSPEARHQLTDALYAVHQQIFDGVEREAFAKYVVESKAEHTWIQVHRNEADHIVGYFALHIFERNLGGVPTAVFRAEAGSLRAYRGGNVTMRFVVPLLLRYMLRHPGRRAYYLGALVHPSSYTLLARHFGEMWPQREAATPPRCWPSWQRWPPSSAWRAVDPARPLVRHVGWKTRDTEAEREYWQPLRQARGALLHAAQPRLFRGARAGDAGAAGARQRGAACSGPVLGHQLHRPVGPSCALARKLPGASLLLRSEIRPAGDGRAALRLVRRATLKALVRRARVPHPARGPLHVFRQGDASDELYLLVRGAAYVMEGRRGAGGERAGQRGGVRRDGPAGRRAPLGVLRTATASTLVRIPREALLPLHRGPRGPAPGRVDARSPSAASSPGARLGALRAAGPPGPAARGCSRGSTASWRRSRHSPWRRAPTCWSCRARSSSPTRRSRWPPRACCCSRRSSPCGWWPRRRRASSSCPGASRLAARPPWRRPPEKSPVRRSSR